MTDHEQSFDIRVKLFVRDENEVRPYTFRLRVKPAETDFVCSLEYGFSETSRTIPIYGSSPWQALLLAQRILFDRLKEVESRVDAAFFVDEAHAQVGEVAFAVEDIFAGLTPI